MPEIIKETDVLILGSGLAGLGAAYMLKNNNLDFVILEAQEVPGGRIKNGYMRTTNVIECKNSKDNIVNAGAQWLHGRENILYKMACQKDLLHSVLSEEGLGKFLRNDGCQIDEWLVKKVDYIVGEILEECEEFVQITNNSNYPSSVGEYLISQFNKRLDAFETIEERTIAKQLLDWHKRFQIIDNSCLSVDDISAKSWGTYSFNGESCQAHINFKNSFYDIIELLVNEIGQNKLKLNTEVETINWGAQFNSCTFNPSLEPKVMIKCKNGNIYVAKHIICTFSIGVLKSVLKTMFNPSLPVRHETAIKSIGFGTINKIFIQFDNAWWGKTKGIQLVFEDVHYENTHWTRFLSGFDVIYPGLPNTLVGWVGGSGAILMEQLSDEVIVNDCIQILKKFTKLNVPQPKSCFVTRWHSNKFIQGSYSFCSKDCDIEDIKTKDLCVPICYKDLFYKDDTINFISKEFNCNNHEINMESKVNHVDNSPLILFAGEACNEKYYSTAHGAFLSGCEQAEKLLEFYQASKVPL